jgi:hypothetical protein
VLWVIEASLTMLHRIGEPGHVSRILQSVNAIPKSIGIAKANWLIEHKRIKSVCGETDPGRMNLCELVSFADIEWNLPIFDDRVINVQEMVGAA